LIRENQKILNFINVFADVVIVVISMLIAYFLRFIVFEGTESLSLRFYIGAALAVSPLFILLFGISELYDSQRSADILRVIEKVAIISLLCTLALATVLYIIRIVDVSRWMLTFFYLCVTLVMILKRFVLIKLLRISRRKGFNIKHALLIGSGESALQYLEAVKKERWLGFNVVGNVGNAIITDEVPHLGSIAELDNVLEKTYVDEAVASLTIEEMNSMGFIIEACEKHGVKLSLIPFCAPYILSHPRMDTVGSIPMINIRYIPLDNIVYNGIKRLSDILFSIILILLLSPLFITALIGTKLSVGSPIIFKQVRVGLNKKHYTMYKFRSMKDARGREEKWSGCDTDRITPFGAFIRKYSIDELPQLFNVLKGDMSLVGPRPELPRFVEMFKKTVPLYMVKHQVRPGITGWAQVNGYRGDTSIVDRINCDIYYIENWSLFLDLKILAMTILRIKNNEEGSIDVKKKRPKQSEKTAVKNSSDEECKPRSTVT
jgi:Undecaprenyl-phosphate glucose phosphotransferase